MKEEEIRQWSTFNGYLELVAQNGFSSHMRMVARKIR